MKRNLIKVIALTLVGASLVGCGAKEENNPTKLNGVLVKTEKIGDTTFRTFVPENYAGKLAQTIVEVPLEQVEETQVDIEALRAEIKEEVKQEVMAEREVEQAQEDVVEEEQYVEPTPYVETVEEQYVEPVQETIHEEKSNESVSNTTSDTISNNNNMNNSSDAIITSSDMNSSSIDNSNKNE